MYIPEFDTVRRSVEGREDEVPCTIALQYLPRDGALHALSYMRSQDVPNVLPYDVFIFTLIQEYVARNTKNELGGYHHVSGSFHFYSRDESRVAKFIESEGARLPLLPQMPEGNQDDLLARVVGLEESIRSDALARRRVPGGSRYNVRPYLEQAAELPSFWKTVVLGLVAHAAIGLGEVECLSTIRHLIDQPLKLFVERALVRGRATTSLERFDKGSG